MTERPKMTWTHAGIAFLGFTAAAIAGLVVGSAILLMFDFGWMMVYFFWPILVLQLIANIFFDGIIAIGRRMIKGAKPAPEVPDPPSVPVPWIRENSGWIGMFVGVSTAVSLEVFR